MKLESLDVKKSTKIELLESILMRLLCENSKK